MLGLFGFESQPELGFDEHRVAGDEDAELDFAARLILDEIGVEYEDPQANTLDSIIERFGSTFPKIRDFSDLARLTLPGVEARDDPDAALLAWLDHEEAMFRRLEHRIVGDRISEGFGSGESVDVDGFLKYSLQVQNRRKSRRGRSFEHHLEAVFRAHELQFDVQARTEYGNTADFLFPGTSAYHDPGFPSDRLIMLAAKSTCKDRWRQVLPEAGRIWPKHLITLEPAISSAQLEQMRAERLQLVLPAGLHATYGPEQSVRLMTTASFVALVREK